MQPRAPTPPCAHPHIQHPTASLHPKKRHGPIPLLPVSCPPAPSGVERRKLGPGPERAPLEPTPCIPHARVSHHHKPPRPPPSPLRCRARNGIQQAEIQFDHPCSVQTSSTHPRRHPMAEPSFALTRICLILSRSHAPMLAQIR